MMLDLINKYCHGFVALPVIAACRKKGLFAYLGKQKKGRRLEDILGAFNANSGHLQITLQLFESLGWIQKNENDAYRLTTKGQQYKQIPTGIIEIYELDIKSILLSSTKSAINPLKRWIEKSINGWDGVEDPVLCDFLDGCLIITSFIGLSTHDTFYADAKSFTFSFLPTNNHSVTVQPPRFSFLLALCSAGAAMLRQQRELGGHRGRVVFQR